MNYSKLHWNRVQLKLGGSFELDVPSNALEIVSLGINWIRALLCIRKLIWILGSVEEKPTNIYAIGPGERKSKIRSCKC